MDVALGSSAVSVIAIYYCKACVKQPLSKRQEIVFKTNYRLMQVKSIAESAILLTFI